METFRYSRPYTSLLPFLTFKSHFKRLQRILPTTLQDFPPSSTGSYAAAIDKKSLPAMVAGVWSDDPSLQLAFTTQFWKLLFIERSPPIEKVKGSGVVPRFFQFLMEHYPQLQVRNDAAGDFLLLLKEWDKLCKRYVFNN